MRCPQSSAVDGPNLASSADLGVTSGTMCRLLGIATSDETDFRIVLREAPRCLAKLSSEHRDGWGIAVHATSDSGGARANDGWVLEKSTAMAGDDDRFHALAMNARGHVLVAHIRQKTVGPTALTNTHPFAAQGWVFAHNGTVRDKPALDARISSVHTTHIEGDTDSERLFRVILSRFDAAGVTVQSPTPSVEQALLVLTAELRAVPDIGSFNFIISDGRRVFAHRFGRSLYVLVRGPGDAVRHVREAQDGTVVVTPWTERKRAVLIASEALTDEPWEEVPDGSLLSTSRDELPEVHWVERGFELQDGGGI
jgi:predicted glutamine amidotransferase